MNFIIIPPLVQYRLCNEGDIFTVGSNYYPFETEIALAIE